jgi:hypothetical protein
MRSLTILAAMLAAAPCVIGKDAKRTSWGEITYDTGRTGIIELEVNARPADGKLSLPTPFSNITQAYQTGDKDRKPLLVSFNPDATQITVTVPEGAKHITLETTEKTTTFKDGRIVFSALDSTVTGAKAKLETHPGNHRIGFWVNINDFVAWEYEATKGGSYDVELTYSLAGGKGNDIVIEYAGKKLTTTIQSTGTWYAYTTVPVGHVEAEDAGKLKMKVYCSKKTAGAAMNLKAVTLRPANEAQ